MISPPGHVECVDIPSTVDFIQRVRGVAGVPTGIKLCMGDARQFEALIDGMCQQDAFPVFITIDNKSLQHGFVVADKARRVANYVHALEHDWRQVVSATGVRCVSELTPDHLYIPPGHPIHRPGQQEVA